MAKGGSRWMVSAAGFAVTVASLVGPAQAMQAAVPGEPMTAAAWPVQPSAPKAAPNVLVILTDDVGFGASSTFGGPVPTPTFDMIAKEGIRYNRFNTTALCSPTRASLLTGRTPHNVNMGNVTNLPTGYPGYTSVIPDSAATIADVLRQNGYGTAMFGKSHLTPEWETGPNGPYDRWPTGLGFDYFYGFLSADSSMFDPSIVENTTPIEPPHGRADYHFEADMADHAISWIDRQRVTAPNRPFFMYYATGTAHTPHHAPAEWLARFRGKFDAGWDRVREETFARQKRAGVIPANAQLTPRPSSFPAWNSLSADQRRVYARLMEAYAASLSFADYQIGRVVESLRASGQLDNTLIIFIQGDNGGSAEGGPNGLLFEQSTITGGKEPFSELLRRIDEIGGPNLYNHYPAAWGWAMNTPFPFYKQVASQAGGVRNALAIRWPKETRERGVVRSQYAHVSDIMPTILEATGIRAPQTFDGVAQQPIDGISLAYTFKDPRAPSARREQVYEMMENFGVYKDGWMAGTLPKRAAWEVGVGENRNLATGARDRKWQLFNLDKDFSTAKDLAAAEPKRLEEMKALFWDRAAKGSILPIHDWSEGREGRPSPIPESGRFVFTPGMTRIGEAAAPHTIGKSFRIATTAVIPAAGASGVIATQGGRFGGYAFYLKGGVPTFHYNAVGADQFTVRGNGPIPAGEHRLEAVFDADTPKPGSPGNLVLKVDGKAVGQGRIGRTVAGWMSHTEGLDIGVDTITPVNTEYTVPQSRFTGELGQVEITIEQK